MTIFFTLLIIGAVSAWVLSSLAVSVMRLWSVIAVDQAGKAAKGE